MPNHEYEVFEEPAVKCQGNSHFYKWGTVIGIRKDIQIRQRLQITDSALKGRVVAIDLDIQTSDGKAFTHRIFGVYAPWDPGHDSSNDFWPALTQLVVQTQTSWSLAGDLNATVTANERTSGGADARLQFIKFLDNVNGIDLWSLNPDRNRTYDWTCKSRAIDANAEASLIGSLYHRAIIRHLILKPTHNSSNIYLPQRVLFSNKPRIKFPSSSEKHRHQTFRTLVDAQLEGTNLFNTEVNDNVSFTKLYQQLGSIINTCTEQAYGRVRISRPELKEKKITNLAIQSQIGFIRSIGDAI
ncbi:hypothetical protein D9758_013811 [Tetrapyrgos nigripes]|uniref:Endonuclease/exonuclease/phosphatase domain-containing protein n=1 Tax=Tetrapyrgos nigripes TaxID=182062 RepID=A0A8H5FT96_9AGAR|nr:hypothetical protein D9758_013811 [Tetrapyrgos nigripes]